MKRTYQLPLIVLFALIIFAAGCKKQTTLLSGNLYGFVSLYDQYGARVYSGQANTNVALVSDASSQTMNTNPDTTGKYSFSNITEGQYVIGFSNVGYGSFSNTPLGFLGGGNIDHDVKLSAIPNFYDSIINAPTDTLNTIVLNGTFSGTDTRKRTYAIFVGINSAVSSMAANYRTFYTGAANNNLTTFTQKINVQDLYDAGFTSGSTVYFAVYGAAANFNSTSDAEDYTTGRLNYTAVSSNPATTSFVLP